jgi:hypothetical protein
MPVSRADAGFQSYGENWGAALAGAGVAGGAGVGGAAGAIGLAGRDRGDCSRGRDADG